MVTDPNQLIFIDESAKDRSSSRRHHIWAKRGLTPYRDTSYFTPVTTRRYTLLAVCNIDGFVLEACEKVEQKRDVYDTDPTRGTIDRDRFKLWVNERLIPTLGRYSEGGSRSIVVMDNAMIHGGDVAELIKSAGARLVYTAPYSPDLNPIEHMFGQYKSSLKRNNNMPWLDAHEASLKAVTPTDARSYFCHCGVLLCEEFRTKKAIQKEEEEVMPFVAATAAAFCVIQTSNNQNKA